MDRLSLLYYANKNVWMRSEILKKWLMSWDMELQWKSRKILLILDKCEAHPHLDSLKNIQREFLFPNTTSLIQPINTGIIKNLKTLYHTKLVNYILEAIQENLLTSSPSAKKVSIRIDLLQTVQFIANSWQIVNTKTI
jgi:hypothetical protein